MVVASTACPPPTGLQLASVDWQSPRNNLQHHTAEIGTRRLMARRGQPFHLRLHFLARGYQPGIDALYFIAETGKLAGGPGTQ